MEPSVQGNVVQQNEQVLQNRLAVTDAIHIDVYREKKVAVAVSDRSVEAEKRMRINRVLIMRRRHTRTGKSSSPYRIVAVLICVAVAIIGASGGTGLTYGYYRSLLPLLNGVADHSLFQTTHIYDRNGKLLYELYNQDQGRRTYVSYQSVSPYIINATIAAEDHSFWTNNGVDFQGIARAAYANFMTHSVVEGGSTVTQQFIKNQFFLSQPRDFQVKGEEALLAAGLTHQLPKWKIMEMYLNTVFYGNENYGIEAAAQDYFGLKPICSSGGTCVPAVAQVTLGEASLLAGLPQGPTEYNPVYYKQDALKRQALVLQSMVDLGMITPTQKVQAQEQMQHFRFTSSYDQRHPMLAPHFVQYLIDEVLPSLFGGNALREGGYNIYTTLDLDLEKKVEQIAYDHLYEPSYSPFISNPYGVLAYTHNVKNAAVTVVNPRNGEILAMDGSAAYNNPAIQSPQMVGQVDAALALRQPGSSFKPIVYATAMEMGWYPGMILPDQPIDFPSGVETFIPHNYDNKYHSGPMTIRRALANSYNIPAVEAIEFAGIKNVVDMAGRLGLSNIQHSDPNRQLPPMALGAIEDSDLDMASAYATFANQGMREPLASVLAITDNQGRLLYKFDESHPHGVSVLSPEVSFMMSSILSDKKARYEEFGVNNSLELDRPAAAKTGTTNDYKDNWTIGYTPYLSVGVWVGNDDNSIMGGVIGITGAAPIWHDVMEYASQKYHFPATGFAPPDDVHRVTTSGITGLKPRPGEPKITDWMIDGTDPTIQGMPWYSSAGRSPAGRPVPVHHDPVVVSGGQVDNLQPLWGDQTTDPNNPILTPGG